LKRGPGEPIYSGVPRSLLAPFAPAVLFSGLPGRSAELRARVAQRGREDVPVVAEGF
jgi:hypothetical protein